MKTFFNILSFIGIAGIFFLPISIIIDIVRKKFIFVKYTLIYLVVIFLLAIILVAIGPSNVGF